MLISLFMRKTTDIRRKHHFDANSIISPRQAFPTFPIALRYPFIHEPTAAKGRESKIILIGCERSMPLPEITDSFLARSIDETEKKQERHIEKLREYRIIFEWLQFPKPISSETSLLVDKKIFPLARTIIKPKTVNMSVIMPTEAVPSLSEITELRNIPSRSNISVTNVRRKVSFAILFI